MKLFPSNASLEFRKFSRIIQQRLVRAGLIDFLDETESGCVENGSAFFVELVLQDGSLIEQAEAVILDIASTFKQEHGHVRVTGVVRAHWAIGSITHVGHCPDESGLTKFSECFKVELESGRGRQIVEIEATPSAFEEIDRSLGVGDQFDEQVIRKLVEHDLNKGGESYWDPIRHPKQYLNDIATRAMI